MRETPKGVSLSCRVKAGATVDTILESGPEILKIAVKAPRVENRANAALQRFLAKHLKIPQKRITITQGLKSPIKTLILTGADPLWVLKHLQG